MTDSPPGQPPWRPSRKPLVIAIAAVVVLGAGLVLTLPDVEPTPLRATSVSRPSESPTSTAVEDRSGGSPVNSAPNVEAQPPPAASVAPSGTVAVAKPAEGRHLYRRTMKSEPDQPEELSWIVSHAGGDVIEKTQAAGREGEPDRESQRYTEHWSATAVNRTALQHPAREDEPTGRRCTMQPPLLELPLPLEVGLRWESAANCGEGKQRTTFERAGNVIRTERISIAGVELDTFVIEFVSGIGQRGTAWFASEGTEWFAPAIGMTVRRHAVTREIETGIGFHEDHGLELLAWPGGPPA